MTPIGTVPKLYHPGSRFSTPWPSAYPTIRPLSSQVWGKHTLNDQNDGYHPVHPETSVAIEGFDGKNEVGPIRPVQQIADKPHIGVDGARLLVSCFKQRFVQ